MLYTVTSSKVQLHYTSTKLPYLQCIRLSKVSTQSHSQWTVDISHLQTQWNHTITDCRGHTHLSCNVTEREVGDDGLTGNECSRVSVNQSLGCECQLHNTITCSHVSTQYRIAKYRHNYLLYNNWK